VVHVT